MMEYYSTTTRNISESVLMRQMNLEPTIHSEASQKEKDKYCILTCVYIYIYIYIYIWNLERWYRRFYFQGSIGDTDIENRLMGTGRGERRVRYMERVTWKLVLPYVKQIANGNLLYGSGNSNRFSVSTQRGGMRREMGGRF